MIWTTPNVKVLPTDVIIRLSLSMLHEVENPVITWVQALGSYL